MEYGELSAIQAPYCCMDPAKIHLVSRNSQFSIVNSLAISYFLVLIIYDNGGTQT